MSNLLLGVRTSLYDFKKIKLENVDFDSKVENFKCEVSRKANIPKDSLGVYIFNFYEVLMFSLFFFN